MRYHEIVGRPAAPATHPFVTDISIDPVQFSTFERLTQDRPEVALLARIDGPDTWLVHIGCASEAIRRRLLDAWS